MHHPTARALKHFGAFGSCAAVVLCTVYVANSAAQSSKESPPPGGTADSGNASPIYGVTIPPGYRDWKVISVGRLQTDKLNHCRAALDLRPFRRER
jgi:hypothetical protein